eukprot:11854065-Ditylum_brightwellii.AAC.1
MAIPVIGHQVARGIVVIFHQTVSRRQRKKTTIPVIGNQVARGIVVILQSDCQSVVHLFLLHIWKK